MVILFFNKIAKENLSRLNLLCILTTLLVYHAIYDLVILLPFLGYLIKNYKKIRFFKIYIFTVLFIFYFYRFNQLILNNLFLDKTLSDIGCLLLIITFFLLIYETNLTKKIITKIK